MVQVVLKTKPVTFEEFALWKPEGGLYELHDGVIIEMPLQKTKLLFNRSGRVNPTMI